MSIGELIRGKCHICCDEIFEFMAFKRTYAGTLARIRRGDCVRRAGHCVTHCASFPKDGDRCEKAKAKE